MEGSVQDPFSFLILEENYTTKVMESSNMNYDVIIVGAGPAGLYAAYEGIIGPDESKKRILVIEKGNNLANRKCPITEGKVKNCINCKSCSIMSGFGGAGAFSDGKFNITNQFGGTLWEKIGKDTAYTLMNNVDCINESLIDSKDEYPKLYTTDPQLKKECLKKRLNLLDARVRHLGTDLNYKILENLYQLLVQKGVDFKFNSEVVDITMDNPATDYKFNVRSKTDTEETVFKAENVIVAVGRSGSHWLENYCKAHKLETESNRVDIGVRVELPAEIFSDITDEVYESKIVYTTEKYQDKVRTFCMNPYGFVVNENTNGIMTVNGHSNSDGGAKSDNTNFALLVSQHFTEPFNNSNEYGESIAKLSNMLGGGVIVQRFGDLIRGQRSTLDRIERSSVLPTLKAVPGDLSLVLPKRILDDIIEMIYALNNIAPGTANDDTLLYGVEVKFYNMEVKLTENLEVEAKPGLYIIGDGSGVTHSLSHAAASGLYVMQRILSQTK